MKATVASLAAMLGLTSISTSLEACTWCYACSPALNIPLGRAPSPCGMPGFYTWVPGPTCYGTVYGPHYCLRPPFPPFNGILPGGGPGGASSGTPGMPGHGGMMPGPGGMRPGPGGMMPGPGGMMPGPGGMMPGPGGMMPGPGGMMIGPGGMAMNIPNLPPHIATPFGGAPNQQAITPVFPTHPYVRGPRDFFMWRENMEERMLREGRPNLIP